MKKLFIRFFDDANDQIPRDSNIVCVDNCGPRERLKAIQESSIQAADWIVTRPKGKVDYVWL